MKHTFVASLLAFAVVLTPTAALAAANPTPVTTRYFLQTTKGFWRNALGARNVFDTGFTADLTDLQLKVAKLAGLKPITAKKFTILAEATPTLLPSSTPTPQPTPATSLPWGVKFILGKSTSASTGKGIKVALLDTGIDTQHPDLADRVTKCTNYTDTAKAFIDQECEDGNGHGTHMAGIVAADGGADGSGIWGLAPQSDLLIYKVCSDDGLCMSDDIAKALRGAVDDGANIVVLGLGGDAASSFIDEALQYAADHDVLVVAAAGNNGPYDDSMDWPARNPLTVSVGALASDGSVADFSSRGTNESTKAYSMTSGDVEVAAPGVNIESTFMNDSYATLSGTSMAAPHIAGLAARIWQTAADHPARATREILHHMAQDIGPAGDDNASGWGAPTY